MTTLTIHGGKKLNFTEVNFAIPGYKHALVPILCSTILFPSIKFTFNNVPAILDAYVLVQILEELGADCFFNPPILVISTANLQSKPIPIALSQQIHGALYLFPVLLGRFGYAEIGKCGGCSIGQENILGNRPFEHVIQILTTLGCQIEVKEDRLIGRLRPSKAPEFNIQDFSDYENLLSGPKVSGATKTAILAGISISGAVIKILSPYLKPDVLELLRFLKLLGHKIQIQPNRVTIQSSSELGLPGEIQFSLIGDISVLMTYITLAIIFKTELQLKHETMAEMLEGLAAECEILKKIGITYQHQDQLLIINSCETLQPVNIEVLSTSIYSDHQPFFVLMLTGARGVSVVKEHVWKTRFNYITELIKLGYQMELQKNGLNVRPSRPNIQQSVDLEANDLRAAATLLLAACKSPTIIRFKGHEHLMRGYENLIGLLKTMGAEICEANN